MIENDLEPYDFIFMDLDMPVVDGLAANKVIIEKIKEIPKYYNSIKIISCTASEGPNI